MLGLVQRLLTHEAAESDEPEALLLAAGRVADKLRAHLSKRIGEEGYRTLLARAAVLTTNQFPRLNAVRVIADGSLAGLHPAPVSGSGETSDHETQAEIVQGVVALLTQFLALLVTFIGEDLTLRLVGTVWPELALPESVLDSVTSGEKETP